VLDAVGVKKVHYWGYSTGARTGMVMLRMRDDRVAWFINGAGESVSPKRHLNAIAHERSQFGALHPHRALRSPSPGTVRSKQCLTSSFASTTVAAIAGLDLMGLRDSLRYAHEQPPQ
jgi:pimeloyl-ACP methyl ester carboxylesterase